MKQVLITLGIWTACMLVCQCVDNACENNSDCEPTECCLQRVEQGKKITKSCQARSVRSQRCTSLPKYHGIEGMEDYFYGHCPCAYKEMVCRFPGTYHPLATEVESGDYFFYSSMMGPKDVDHVMDMLHGRCLLPHKADDLEILEN